MDYTVIRSARKSVAIQIKPDGAVVVRELCHRKHMDHSAAFYAEVRRVFPNYDRCSRWLKENGNAYLSRLG